MGGACSRHGKNEQRLKILIANPEWKRPFRDLDVGGKIILEWILRK